jgi:hypothetical protein
MKWGTAADTARSFPGPRFQATRSRCYLVLLNFLVANHGGAVI